MAELPAAFNDGWAYRDRIAAADLGTSLVDSGGGGVIACWYAARYAHSDREAWRQRLAAGQIWRNGQQLWCDGPLAAGDRLVWHRPPWQEAAVPVLPSPLFDDGDLLVFNKPSGLPVLPAGGFLRHTVLGQIDLQVKAELLDARAGHPRPVHRLGRYTSGLLVCARSHGARAWLGAQLRDSTQNAAADGRSGFVKLYRACLSPPQPASPMAGLVQGASLEVATPIGRWPHPRLGTIWCAAGDRSTDSEIAAAAADNPVSFPLAARSRFTVLALRPDRWLVEVAIATGRPHQIRIHAAAAGAPLLGDPLYLPGGRARSDALPGDGGYALHAQRLRLRRPDGSLLELQAPVPASLQL